MCDYSLMIVPNRLAIEGEDLVAHKFQSGTTGFVSYSDFTIWRAEQRSKSLWHRLKGWFASKPDPDAGRLHSTRGAPPCRSASNGEGAAALLV